MARSTVREFRERVAEAAQGTPYEVRETDKGFDVYLDVADARWYGLLNKAGLTSVYTHHVVVRGGEFMVTDDFREVRWAAGVPRVAVGGSRVHGRYIACGSEKAFALDKTGRPAKVLDYRFDSEEGRHLITLVGKAMGLREKLPASALFGLIMGFVAVGGIVVMGLGILVWWLFFK